VKLYQQIDQCESGAPRRFIQNYVKCESWTSQWQQMKREGEAIPRSHSLPYTNVEDNWMKTEAGSYLQQSTQNNQQEARPWQIVDLINSHNTRDGPKYDMYHTQRNSNLHKLQDLRSTVNSNLSSGLRKGYTSTVPESGDFYTTTESKTGSKRSVSQKPPFKNDSRVSQYINSDNYSASLNQIWENSLILKPLKSAK